MLPFLLIHIYSSYGLVTRDTDDLYITVPIKCFSYLTSTMYTIRDIDFNNDLAYYYIYTDSDVITEELNDMVDLTKSTIDACTYREFMSSFYEVDGVFGKYDRNGIFSKKPLEKIGLIPSETLIPREDLIPSDIGFLLAGTDYRKFWHDEYVVNSFNRIVVIGSLEKNFSIKT